MSLFLKVTSQAAGVDHEAVAGSFVGLRSYLQWNRVAAGATIARNMLVLLD